MTNNDILKIDGVEYDHASLLGLAKQSPTIKIRLSDIEVYGININSNHFNSEEIELNNTFENNDICVFSFFGKTILLTGYNKYNQAKQTGKEEINVKLISKPVLKKAKFDIYVKPSFLGKTTVSYKRSSRSVPDKYLGQGVSQKSSKPLTHSR